MNSTKEQTCAERINASMESTEEDLKAIFDVLSGKIDPESEESETAQIDNAYEELYGYALGMDTRQETIITLSWGGPASYLEVTHRGAEIYTITYRFSDWFDTATQEITDQESAIWRYSQDIIDTQEGNC
jgi:hypothetical protein